MPISGTGDEVTWEYRCIHMAVSGGIFLCGGLDWRRDWTDVLWFLPLDELEPHPL